MQYRGARLIHYKVKARVFEPCSEYFLEKEQFSDRTEDVLNPRDWNGLVLMAAVRRRLWVADCDEFDPVRFTHFSLHPSMTTEFSFI